MVSPCVIASGTSGNVMTILHHLPDELCWILIAAHSGAVTIVISLITRFVFPFHVVAASCPANLVRNN